VTSFRVGQRVIRRRDGFTLLELLAVIAIIAVLTSIVIGVGRRASETGKVARAKAELAVLSAALESYRRHYTDYPQTGVVSNDPDAASPAAADGPGILFNALAGKRGPLATLTPMDARVQIELAKFTLQNAGALPIAGNTAQLANAFFDPWGRRYLYVYRAGTSWTNPSYVLWSVGPDGADAGLTALGFINVAPAENADNLYANRN
jgi:general secretion pathway protein G